MRLKTYSSDLNTLIYALDKIYRISTSLLPLMNICWHTTEENESQLIKYARMSKVNLFWEQVKVINEYHFVQRRIDKDYNEIKLICGT